ncbi:MAG: 2-isopropylmalate synthase [Clostridiales bacterium]|nr:2-isopropylmalate synthase [Clostridiales bacterium]
MSKRIYIFDTTLRDGEQSPGISLNIHEKVEIAAQLERLGVDAIEAGFPIASKGDFEAVKAIAQKVRTPVIVGLARAVKGDIERAWEALKYAAHPRIHTFIATSDIHMEYKLKMTPEEVLNRVREMVTFSKSLCPDVEFSTEDGSRTRPEFLFKVIETAIEAGANVINIPDTVGYSTPSEFGGLIKSIFENVRGIEDIILSVHCHNDLGMAVPNSLAAVQNGANQVECTINGLGERAGNAALEEIVMALRTRKDFYGCDTGVNTREIYRSSRLISHLTGVHIQPNKAITGANAFAHESGIHQHGVLSNRETYEIMTPESVGVRKSEMVLGKHSGRHAFVDKLKEMGYEHLEPAAINEAFERFKDLADRKKDVLDRDIEALINQKVTQIPEIYSLDYFHISSGNSTIATSTVQLKKGDEVIQEAACGDGPVDATFKAIDRAAGIQVNLKDYYLKAVTGGKDALGEVTVKVSKNGKVFLGRGISTDVLEASAKSYINAINKMVYETENERL